MPVTWLAPAVLAALSLVAVPVAIHLLVRERSRPRPFPTVRFLRETRLASVTWRGLHDRWLLVVRVLVIALAVAALAAPVWIGAGRRDAWSSRVARAVVTTAASAEADAVVTEREGATYSATIARDTLDDGVLAAVRWLDMQPPASRELVVVAPLARDTLHAPAVAAVPQPIGIRFVRTREPAGTATVLETLQSRDGAQVRVPFTLALDPASTTVSAGEPEPVGTPVVRVEATPEDQAAAEATLAAVLAEGVALPLGGSRRALVSWSGPSAPEGLDVADSRVRDRLARLRDVTARQDGDLFVIGLGGTPGDVAAARRLAVVLAAVFGESLEALEPAPIDDATLAAWTREPGAVPDVPPADEGDRRWLWGAVLGLLALEQWMRRRTADGESGASAVPPEVGRVA